MILSVLISTQGDSVSVKTNKGVEYVLSIKTVLFAYIVYQTVDVVMLICNYYIGKYVLFYGDLFILFCTNIAHSNWRAV